MMKQQALQHISAVASAAADGHFGSLSTGEKLAAALVLGKAPAELSAGQRRAFLQAFVKSERVK